MTLFCVWLTAEEKTFPASSSGAEFWGATEVRAEGW